MDQTTYPGSVSETDNNDDYDQCEFYSTTSNELDFVNRWVNLTVEKEVLRGSQIRDEKLKTYPHLLEQCDFINVDLSKSPCVEENSKTKNATSGKKKGKTTSCSPRSHSPSAKQSQWSRCESRMVYSRLHTPNVNTRSLPRCSMRIAELAVPTKRQCIDTWRNKCDVLPACMVERLRQQVMDEKPIVQISEAINCFQRKTPKSFRSMNKRSKKNNSESKQKNERDAEIRKLCAAFADKIARKLITPRDLKLNSELDRLSKIVANEITAMIQNRKKFDLNNDAHKKIHADISAKIAVWIATILEDSSYKLLEEDLRVQSQSGKIFQEDRIVTLIENFHQKRISELEEEEGPVLDLIDNLVDNVVTICEPELMNTENADVSDTTSIPIDSGEHCDIDSPESTGNDQFDASTLYTNITHDTGDGTTIMSNEIKTLGSKTQVNVMQVIKNLSFDQDISKGIERVINDHIKEEIDNIIDSVTNNVDTMTTDNNITSNDLIVTADNRNESIASRSLDENRNSKYELTNETGDLKIQTAPVELPIQRSMVEEVTPIPNVTNEIDKSNQLLEPAVDESNDMPDLTIVEEATPIFNMTNEVDQSSQLIESSVNPDFLDISTEDSLDEKNKKVKFSEIEMAVIEFSEKLDKRSNNHTNREEKESKKASTNNINRNLVVGPPNEHLLSNADESWPEDLGTPVLKPSASVSRSVTSLGRILEKDEKLLSSEDEILSVYESDGSPVKEYTDIDKNGEQIHLQKESESLNHVDVLNNIEGNLGTTKTDWHSYSSIEKIQSSQILDNATDLSKSVAKGSVVNKVKEDNEKPTEIGVKENLDARSLKILGHRVHDFEKGLSQHLPQRMNVMEQNVFKNVVSGTNLIYEAVQQKIKALPEPKFDYKVHPKNAPSWLRQDRGKGEPSEDSFTDKVQTKAKFKDSDLRSWCKDLDRMFVNLEMWNGWVDTMCKDIMHLKQKREMNKLFAPHAKRKDAKDWSILKKNIDKDAVLWTKLNQRAYERLKCYKDKAKNRLVEKSELVDVKSNESDIETILKTIEDIDRIFFRIHQTIVSTEYCMACDCKNNPRRKL